ncbi:MAG TPA: pyridoxal phosphate-dependent aminotransferase [Gemmatimonadaceae bacterium]|nr:pyridoxal phosphate-dependent aminotransferase [Gemmatimonadaceae bacterium]
MRAEITRPLESEYLEWARSHGTLPYSLAISGVPPCDVSLLSPSVDDFTMVADNEYGWAPLLERIATRYGVRPDNVVLAHGTSMANHLACAAIVGPGDHVVAESPVYDPLVTVPRYLGCEVDYFERSEEKRFALDVDRIESALRPRTRLVILSNLHNPTGAIAHRSELEDLGRLAEARDFQVLVDEVYLEWIYGWPGEAATAMSLSERFVTTRSLTKVFGLAALRAGWVLAESNLAIRLRRLNGLFASSMSHPAERLAVRALDNGEILLKNQRARVDKNRSIVAEFIEGQRKLSWVPPETGTVGFVRLEGGNVDDLVERLLQQKSLVTPGRFFGLDDHFRIGFGMERSQLEAGLDRLDASLKKI